MMMLNSHKFENDYFLLHYNPLPNIFPLEIGVVGFVGGRLVVLDRSFFAEGGVGGIDVVLGT